MSFSDVVEAIRSLSLEEKQEIQNLALLNPSMNWWVATFLERPLNPPQVRDFESPRVPQNGGLGGKFISLFSNAQNLLTQYLREERRDELYQSYQRSLLEEQSDELKFSSNINESKQLIEE